MQNSNKRERDLHRIEEAQRLAQHRMANQEERINMRFDRMRERLAQKYGEASDSQIKIVDAALELLKEDGLNNLSLRKLASRIDMKAPAIYWHFNNKDVLVDYMAESILNREFKNLKPKTSDEAWQDWLVKQMLKLRKAMLAFPDGARVVAGAHLQPAVTLGNIFECVLNSLENSGFSIREARHILMTASTYTFGFVIEEQSSPNLDEVEDMMMSEMRNQYPYMIKSIEDARQNRRDLEEDYMVGLNYIIKGASSK